MSSKPISTGAHTALILFFMVMASIFIGFSLYFCTERLWVAMGICLLGASLETGSAMAYCLIQILAAFNKLAGENGG